MNQAENNRKGRWALLRRICASLLGLVQSRFELFATEIQEEKARMLNLMLWVGFALAVGAAGLFIGLGALSLFLWTVAGYVGLVGFALAALIAAGGIVWGIRRRLKASPRPFAGTISEFRKDRECLSHAN